MHLLLDLIFMEIRKEVAQGLCCYSIRFWFVLCKMRNIAGFCIRLTAFINYCSFLFSGIQGGIYLSKVRLLQPDWSSRILYMAWKVLGAYMVPTADWLKHHSFSLWFINAVCRVNSDICTADAYSYGGKRR